MAMLWMMVLGLHWSVLIATERVCVHRGTDISTVQAEVAHLKNWEIQRYVMGQVSETISRLNFMRCSALCLSKSDCVGVVYDRDLQCHLLSSTDGIREMLNDRAIARVVLYE